MTATPRTRYARAGDVNIAYQVAGDGPVDLLLCWGTMSHVELMWDDPFNAYFLERLASFSRLIVFDKRGCGLSDRVSGLPSLEERIDDVRAVMDAVGSERAAVFGESEGGPMSMLFAASHPERVSALVLYGAIVRWVDETFEGAHRPDDFHAIVEHGVENWGEGEVIAWFAPSARALGPEMLREACGRFERAAFSPGAFRQLMLMNADIDARPIARAVGVPTLVLHRTDDAVVDVRQGRWLAEHIPGARYQEFEGSDHLPQAGDPEPIIAATQEFVTGTRSAAPVDRIFATVVFTDIVDSTRRAEAAGDRLWRTILDRHDALVTSETEAQRGRVVKTTGDGALLIFDGPVRAITCAQRLHRALGRLGLTIRAGLHCGEVEVRGDDVGGIGVHIAARVSALAGAGEVLVSSTVRDIVAGSGIRFDDRGVHDLKGVEGEWRIFAVED
jgi:pimeloyl-ACP methyl ester carboxylesterase